MTDFPQTPEGCVLNTLGGRCFITGSCEWNLKMKHCPKGYDHLYSAEQEIEQPKEPQP